MIHMCATLWRRIQQQRESPLDGFSRASASILYVTAVLQAELRALLEVMDNRREVKL